MQICSIGECMAELSSYNNENYKLSFAGDTANTAIYLSRLGVNVSYLTSIGTDILSDRMLNFLKKEKLNIKYILRNSNKTIGLYIVENNKIGERNFYYWRSSSAAKYYFESVNINTLLHNLQHYNLIYFSGITLSIYNERNINKFYLLLKKLKSRNTMVCMDLNVRINNWKSQDLAIKILKRFYKLTDLVFLTIEDVLFLGFNSFDLFNKAFKNTSATKIYRNGLGKIIVCKKNFTQLFGISLKKKVLDTTGCGDAFNAAFIYHYLNKAGLENSIKFAHKLAKKVAHYKGAIIPIKNFKKDIYL